jgi:hypothetical protein
MNPNTEPQDHSELTKALLPCLVCGTPYRDGDDGAGCPVCLLRRVLKPSLEERGVSSSEPSPDDGRFDHYQLARRPDDAFEELGRGAMGITYRAVDTILGNAVALKVIDVRKRPTSMLGNVSCAKPAPPRGFAIPVLRLGKNVSAAGFLWLQFLHGHSDESRTAWKPDPSQACSGSWTLPFFVEGDAGDPALGTEVHCRTL